VVAPLAIQTEKPAHAKTNGHEADHPDKIEVLASAT